MELCATASASARDARIHRGQGRREITLFSRLPIRVGTHHVVDVTAAAGAALATALPAAGAGSTTPATGGCGVSDLLRALTARHASIGRSALLANCSFSGLVSDQESTCTV
jgi:hypothetical protein